MPPIKTTTRNIQVFALHFRLPNGPVDYSNAFGVVSEISPADRIVEVGDNKVLGFTRMDRVGDFFRIVALEGEPGELPLILNVRTATDRVGQLRKEEILAQKTHCLVDPAKRLAVIEYNHKGPKSERIGTALEILLRRDPRYEGATVELNPQADESFISAIDRFERVKMASLKIARPNLDWTDYHHAMTEIGADSEGEKIEVVVTAARSRSLSKVQGVVHFIKSLAREGLSILKGAKLQGVREGETAPTTISLFRFIKHQRIHVKLGTGNQVDEADIFDRMTKFLQIQGDGQRND